jgi:CTP:molybdopterin cytidylyltransferase MocA
VLAAGEGARLGTCKALARLRAEEPSTPLGLLLEAGALLDSSPPLVVSGCEHEALLAAAPPAAEVLRNARWSEGRTGSVRLAALARPGQDLCLAPVDVPLVERAVFSALLRAWSSAGSPPRGWLAPFVRAEGRQRFGHPVLVGRELARELEHFFPDRPLRELRERADPLLAVEVDSRSILDDLDRPGDLERLRAELAGRPRKSVR